jgi:hypothetical protein
MESTANNLDTAQDAASNNNELSFDLYRACDMCHSVFLCCQPSLGRLKRKTGRDREVIDGELKSA